MIAENSSAKFSRRVPIFAASEASIYLLMLLVLLLRPRGLMGERVERLE